MRKLFVGSTFLCVSRAILLPLAYLVLPVGVLQFSGPTSDGADDLAPVENNSVKQPEAFDAEGNAITKGNLRICVVDDENRPIAGAKIHVSVWTHEKDFKANQDYTSDGDGQLDAQLPSKLYILRLWADKPGYVSSYHSWENRLPRQPVPDEFTFRLQTGTVIGGKVVDEDGKPIAGAKLTIQGYHGGRLQTEETTDSQGRWKIDKAPSGDKLEIRVIASHPDFVSLRSEFDVGLEKPLPIEELRAQTASIVMKRGIQVMGTVTDPHDRPVPRAW